MKRFCEKSLSFEYIFKFSVKVEKTEESSIAIGDNMPGEVIDQKERRRFVRKEIQAFNQEEIFFNSSRVIDSKLFPLLIKLVTKAN